LINQKATVHQIASRKYGDGGCLMQTTVTVSGVSSTMELTFTK